MFAAIQHSSVIKLYSLCDAALLHDNKIFFFFSLFIFFFGEEEICCSVARVSTAFSYLSAYFVVVFVEDGAHVSRRLQAVDKMLSHLRSVLVIVVLTYTTQTVASLEFALSAALDQPVGHAGCADGVQESCFSVGWNILRTVIAVSR